MYTQRRVEWTDLRYLIVTWIIHPHRGWRRHHILSKQAGLILCGQFLPKKVHSIRPYRNGRGPCKVCFSIYERALKDGKLSNDERVND